MARSPKPWFNRERRGWFVTIDGVRHNLGRNKKQAMEEFHRLMLQPAGRRKVSPKSVAAIIDAFLGWVQKHRSVDTYEWYRYRVERFCRRYPDLRVDQLKPYHVQEWADSYELSKTSRRNYLRAVKRKRTRQPWLTGLVGCGGGMYQRPHDKETGNARRSRPRQGSSMGQAV